MPFKYKIYVIQLSLTKCDQIEMVGYILFNEHKFYFAFVFIFRNFPMAKRHVHVTLIFCCCFKIYNLKLCLHCIAICQCINCGTTC